MGKSAESSDAHGKGVALIKKYTTDIIKNITVRGSVAGKIMDGGFVLVKTAA